MQTWGSGTSPKLFGGKNDAGLVAITNNADPQIAVNVFNRTDGSLICSTSIYGKGTSATTTSFVGYENSLFGVNNYGMEPGVSGASVLRDSFVWMCRGRRIVQLCGRKTITQILAV